MRSGNGSRYDQKKNDVAGWLGWLGAALTINVNDNSFL
jgi:hypothetical protein